MHVADRLRDGLSLVPSCGARNERGDTPTAVIPVAGSPQSQPAAELIPMAGFVQLWRSTAARRLQNKGFPCIIKTDILR